jgi:hypothetical protein
MTWTSGIFQDGLSGWYVIGLGLKFAHKVCTDKGLRDSQIHRGFIVDLDPDISF